MLWRNRHYSDILAHHQQQNLRKSAVIFIDYLLIPVSSGKYHSDMTQHHKGTENQTLSIGVAIALQSLLDLFSWLNFLEKV